MPTLLAARADHYARNAFGEDGGFSKTWDEASFGPIPYAVPNPRARARALQVHDFHHVLTGYPTDWRGESMISAWELGSGGAGRHVYAWMIALFGFVVGMLALPRATLRAFRRGRGERNLYGELELERWHPRSVAAAQAELGIGSSPRALGLRARDLAYVALAMLAGLPVLGLTVLLAPLMVALALSRRARAWGRALIERVLEWSPCSGRGCAFLGCS